MKMKTPLVLPALRRLVLLLLLVLPVLRSHAANPNPPQVLAYQGYLTDGNGNALGSTNVGPKNYNVVFRIWDVQTGGTLSPDEIYAEQQTVTVNNGYFSVLLGQGISLTGEPYTNAIAGVFTGPNAGARYVEITVLGIGQSGAAITILPRLQLLTSPYSFLAANAVNAASAGSLVNNNNSVNVVTVTNNDVGIGTTTPSANLSVAGSANFAGNVGIGTTTPAGVLEIDGIYASSPLLTIKQTTTNGWGSAGIFSAYRYITTASVSDTQGDGAGFKAFNVGAGGVSIGYPNNTPVYGSSDALYVDGNVGIGTTTPTSVLSVAGTLTLSNPGGGNMVSMFNPATDGTNGWALYYGFYGSNNLGIGRYVNGSYPGNLALTITTNGFVGIGTAFPGQTLEVNGTLQADSTGSFNGGIYINSTNGLHQSSAGPLNVDAAGIVGGRLAVTTGGNVGIGTNNPAQTLEVNGNAQVDGGISSPQWGIYNIVDGAWNGQTTSTTSFTTHGGTILITVYVPTKNNSSGASSTATLTLTVDGTVKETLTSAPWQYATWVWSAVVMPFKPAAGTHSLTITLSGTNIISPNPSSLQATCQEFPF